jgi:hypothetical protein
VDPAPLLAPPLPPSTCRTRRRRRASLLSWGCRTSCITRCFGTRGHRSIWSLQVVGNKKNDLRNKSRGPDDTAPAKTCVFLVSPISGHGDDEYRFLPSKNHHRDAKHMAEKMFFSFLSFFLTSMFQTLSSALAHRDLFLFTSALVVYRLDSSVLTYRV